MIREKRAYRTVDKMINFLPVTLKTDQPCPQDILHMPPDYRHADRYFERVMTIIYALCYGLTLQTTISPCFESKFNHIKYD